MLLKIKNKQQGMTLVSWLVVIAFLLFQGIMAIKIAPVYMTNSSVSNVFSALPTDAEVRGKLPPMIRKVILKRFKINNLYNLVTKDQIKIKKKKGYYEVVMEYEPRGTMIGNLDYIISFRHEARIPVR